MRDLDFWALNHNVVFLNHGSFGACPLRVLECQFQIRRHIERNPTRFYVFEHFEKLDEVRRKLAMFLNADPEGLVFTPNATFAINAALLSAPLSKGDEVLVTDHCYGACLNAASYIAGEKGATVRKVHIPFPVSSQGEIMEAILKEVSSKTRLLLVDHVASPSSLIFPVEEISSILEARGVLVVVDGAHAPGMLDLNLSSLSSSFYVGTCHKWICAPKGAAFLYVREDLRQHVRSPILGFGLTWPEIRASRFKNLFDWPGTFDPSPILSVPEAIDCLERKLAGGWAEVRQRNKKLALRAAELLCEELQIELPCPGEMLGAMATLILPIKKTDLPQTHWLLPPLAEMLSKRYCIEVAVPPWEGENVILRISAQLYNELEDYALLASALKEILKRKPG